MCPAGPLIPLLVVMGPQFKAHAPPTSPIHPTDPQPGIPRPRGCGWVRWVGNRGGELRNCRRWGGMGVGGRWRVVRRFSFALPDAVELRVLPRARLAQPIVLVEQGEQLLRTSKQRATY